MAKNKSLVKVNMGHNSVAPQGCAGRSIAALLSDSTTLRSLSVTWCNIAGAAAFEVASAIEDSGLETLDLSWNSFGSSRTVSVADALAGSLARNTSLTHLDLRHNQLNEKDAAVLAKGLEDNHTLVGLHITVSILCFNYVITHHFLSDRATKLTLMRMDFCSQRLPVIQ
jgi:hypothetical protein